MLAGMNLTSWFRVPKWQCPASPAEQFRGYQWAGIWLCLYLYIQLGSEEPLLGEPTYRVFPASAPCCPIFWHTALLPFPYSICSAIGAPTPASSSFSGLQASRQDATILSSKPDKPSISIHMAVCRKIFNLGAKPFLSLASHSAQSMKTSFT